MALTHLPENPRQEARAWNLQLGVPGFKYADLNRVRRLEALDAAFLATLRETDPALAADFERYRNADGKDRERLQESELLIKVAPYVGAFIARLFHIADAYDALCARVRADQGVFEWKRQFIERNILKNLPSAEAIAAGKLVYEKLECSKCHGPEGKGDGPSASELRDDWGFPIKVRDFASGIFKGGSTERDLYLRFTTG